MTRGLLLDDLLADGRSLVRPTEEEDATLALAVDAGLVELRRDQVLRCFDPHDDGAADHPTRACSAWVPCLDSDEDVAVCPTCGTEHAPQLERRTLHERVVVRVLRDGLAAWLDAAVRSVDPDARRLRTGVAWSLVIDDQDVVVVWLDGSLGTPLVTRSFATGQIVVYVVTSPRSWTARFREDPWLTPMSVGSWLAGGDDALRAAVARAVDRPHLAHEPATRVWAAERSADARIVARPLGARVLVVGDGGATLDDVEVVGGAGTGVLPILRLLVERWREDVSVGKAPADHCTWTADELRAELAASDTPAPKPDTLRRQLGRLRAGISERYQRETGVPLDENAVIELVGGSTYRLNPSLLARIVEVSAPR